MNVVSIQVVCDSEHYQKMHKLDYFKGFEKWTCVRPTETQLHRCLKDFNHNIHFVFHWVLCPFKLLFLLIFKEVDQCGSLGSLRRINLAKH